MLRFADHKVVHAKSASFDTATRRLTTTDVVVIVFHRWLVTLRSGPGFRIEGVLEEWDDNADLAHEGVAFLLHGVLGELIDGYLDVLDDLDEEINDVEDDLLDGSGPGRSIQVRTFELRRAVAALSRIALPMTEVLAVLTRGGPGETAMAPLLQDVYQHAIRSAERIDGLRDSIESILSTSLAMQGNSLNEIMKKLTAWAAIIAIPTGVTGYFGQNVPFPGFGQASGFWFSAACWCRSRWAFTSCSSGETGSSRAVARGNPGCAPPVAHPGRAKHTTRCVLCPRWLARADPTPCGSGVQVLRGGAQSWRG